MRYQDKGIIIILKISCEPYNMLCIKIVSGLIQEKLGLSLVAMTVAASVQAKTLVYCSEGSPEGFNPQLFTSGTTYDASSVPL